MRHFVDLGKSLDSFAPPANKPDGDSAKPPCAGQAHSAGSQITLLRMGFPLCQASVHGCTAVAFA